MKKIFSKVGFSNYKKIFNCMIFISGLFFCVHFAYAEALNLPKDSEGWTIFTPSDDSRIMYVSEQGNDSLGTVYTSSNHPDWQNPQNPTGTINTFATYSAAFANAREGYPDWILFKRGNVFTFRIQDARSGRSASEPTLIGAYGSTGDIPLFEPTASGISLSKESPSSPKTAQYIAYSGLNFYFRFRNPNDSEFLNSNAANGFSITAGSPGNVIKNIHIEGCRFSYQSNNIIQSWGGADPIDIVTIRRNVITHSYSELAHAQGIGAGNVNGLLVEENNFYHNGWLIQSLGGGAKENGQATIHNHSVYVMSNCDNVIIKNNISISPSSIHFKLAGDNLISPIVDNNLAIDGEIGVDCSNNYEADEFRVKNATVSNNIFSHINLSRPLNRGVAWGLFLAGWDGGSAFGNIMLESAFLFTIRDQSRDAEIYNNIVYKYPHNDSFTMEWYTDVTGSNLSIHDNYIETLLETRRFLTARAPIDGLTFFDNQYYSPGSTDFSVEDVQLSFNQWQSEYEPSATFGQKNFTDSARTIETYHASIGGTAELDAFIAGAIAQDRYLWDNRYSANAVNNYIRAGFVSADTFSPSAPMGLSVL